FSPRRFDRLTFALLPFYNLCIFMCLCLHNTKSGVSF
uniref:Uncharacterized protein n=1 Tax=Anopheles atroparvus TaxID=41427 RepID=A0AAG5DW37_ANOAO